MKCHRIVTGIVLTIALAAFIPGTATAQDGGSDLDQRLLDQLEVDDEVLEGLADEAATSGEAEPAEGAAESDSKPLLDEQLLEALEEGEDIPLESGDAEVVELGEDTDPLTPIAEKMRLVERLLVRKASEKRVSKLQDEIVKDLEELLKKLRQMAQQQQSSSSQASKPQPSRRSQVNLPKRGKQPKPGNRPTKAPIDKTDDRVRKPIEKEKTDKVAFEKLIDEIWGHLPPKMGREVLRQKGNVVPLPENESMIKRYFRRLAEEDDER